MSRFLKVLPLPLAFVTLALAALSLLFTSCGSSNAEARFVNAISDAGTLEIEFNGIEEFASVAVNTASGSTYVGVPSGSDSVEGLPEGSTTPAFPAPVTVSLSSGAEYTLVATGFLTGTVIILNPVDNNTAPAIGTVNFRVINASPSPSAVDVYILPNPVTCALGSPGCTAIIGDLAFGSVSGYVKENYNSSGNGFSMIVTTHGSTTPIFNDSGISVGSSSVGSVRTFVLTGNSSGTAMNPSPILLDDLN